MEPGGIISRIAHWRKSKSSRSAPTTGEILLDEDGGAYWKESGNYLPNNCVEILLHTDFKFSPEATAAAKDRQQDEFLARYRSTAHIVSAEELCEMRAAFGPGETVVNLITGESIRL